MKSVYLILIALVIVILQTTVMQLFRVVGVVPNLMLIWLIIAAVIFDRLTSFKAAFFAGLFTDILISKGIGMHIAIYIPIVVVIASLEEKIFKDNYITPVILIVMSTAYFHLFYLIVHYFSTGDFVLFPRLFTIVFPETLYNLVLGVICYVLAFRISEGYQMR